MYPSAHEPDLCVASASAGAVVQITDSRGQVLRLTVNASGNFLSQAAVALPFQAKVLFQGRERIMSTPQMSGDCNSCHTQAGANGAPGRILLP